MTHKCINKQTVIGSGNGLSLSYNLNQCWNIVNRTLRNKVQWNFYQNPDIFIQENPFQNGVWKMAAILSRPQCINSLAPGRLEWHFRCHFQTITLLSDSWHISWNCPQRNVELSMSDIFSIFCQIARRWMPQHLTDDKSTMVQVMAWCHQTASHYLSQYWSRSMLPYDITRPQGVKI